MSHSLIELTKFFVIIGGVKVLEKFKTSAMKRKSLISEPLSKDMTKGSLGDNRWCYFASTKTMWYFW
jgi:hypothetical protein